VQAWTFQLRNMLDQINLPSLDLLKDNAKRQQSMESLKERSKITEEKGVTSAPVADSVVEEDTTGPQIRITRPPVSRGVVIKEKAKATLVEGIATDESGIRRVLVNGAEAKLSGAGDFSAEISLAVGENRIRVTASDTKGNIAEETFVVIRDPDVPVPPPLSMGDWHALLIACQKYGSSGVQNLDQPVHDAEALRDILSNQYTFSTANVEILRNPSRDDIIGALEAVRKKVKAEDSLLIYYGGHGHWDSNFRQGYWLPCDATNESRTKWVSNATVSDFIRGIKTRHTLLIADACFSGGILKNRKAFIDKSRAFAELHKLPSRKAITSGTHNEVPDQSVFMEYLLKRLHENEERHLPSEQLFASFRQAVINNSPISQIPQFGVIRETGDEGGDFIFIRRQ